MKIKNTMVLEQPETQSNQKQTLLIVDDESGPRESLHIIFKNRYHCAVATGGREGLEYARTHRVDVAILDIKMPDLSGIDVLREIKKIDPHIECIMLTGYETLETACTALQYGAADYLNKPFDVFSVRRLLEKCMERRQRKLAVEGGLQSLRRMKEDLSRKMVETDRAVGTGELSVGVVHEISDPLSIIARYAQLLAHDLASLGIKDQNAEQQVEGRLTAIQSEIDRCNDIAHGFLNFSRGSQSEENAEVSRLVEDAATLIKAHPSNQGADISVSVTDPALRLKFNPAEMRVKVNPVEIIQVLINLGINALQEMNGTGTLRFSAKRVAFPPAECAFRSPSFDPQHPLVKISVGDSGHGFSPEKLKKIFEPDLTNKTNGTGMGLAIVYKIVGQLGGLIEVQSTPDQGSTFSIYLPLAN